MKTKALAFLKFSFFSALGAIFFFVPVRIGVADTIIIDHVVGFAITQARPLAVGYTIVVIAWGIVTPFRHGTWSETATTRTLAILQIIALPLAIMYVTGFGPAFVMAPDVLPFLFEKLAMPVALVIPVGAICLTFLIGFGLLESIGVLMEPLMRPVFKTPGRSAIDAIASFAGSYSIGLLITGRVYRSGMYSAREAAIIATGFSTVSATFMVIVAKTLGLIEDWNAYFFGTMIVTFSVTAIGVRLPPISLIDNAGSRDDTTDNADGSRISLAISNGLEVARKAPALYVLVMRDLRDGLNMTFRVVPSILSMGMIGLLAAKYTPIFDVIGLFVAPIVWLFFPEGALEIAGIIASGLAEMFLPSVQAVTLDYPVRFVIGIVSVSSILFLSASIPCVLAAGIPLSLGQMLVVWFLRTILSLPCAVGVAHLFGVL